MADHVGVTESHPVLRWARANQTKEHRTMRKIPIAATACVLVLGGLLAGCGDDGDSAGEPTPTQSTASSQTPSSSPPTPTPAGTVINATIRGNDLEPNGERIKVGVGEEITINIDADRAGELHVHSTPEQELEYPKGTSTVKLTLTTPGIVEIEDHVADKVLVSLEVS